jgi:hypothetical protein
VKQHHLLFRNPREKFIHIFDRKQLKKNHLLLDHDRLEYLQQQHVHLLCLFVIFFLFTWRNCCITVTVISHFYFFSIQICIELSRKNTSNYCWRFCSNNKVMDTQLRRIMDREKENKDKLSHVIYLPMFVGYTSILNIGRKRMNLHERIHTS